jgi:hypothetical protein
MFATSDKYKEVIRNTSEQYLMGVITTSDGTTVEINDSVISNGSVSISKQSMTGQELSFGGAILGELDISIRTDVSRYLMYGATIDLWCRVVVDGNSEYIPMGVWVIAEAERDKKALKMVAYDNLIKFNKKYDLALEGTPYELMSAFAAECGCELAEDIEYYLSLTNGNEYISVNQDTGCGTFRDAASVVAQMCGCFVESDRYGKISMRRFHTEPDFSLTKSQRYSSVISDFICHYIEVEITSRAGNIVSINEEFDVGMKMQLDDAPAWDYGLEEILQQRADNLRTALEQIYYTPCEVSIPSDPAIDCGDMVTLHTDDGDVNSLITSYVWTYHGVMNLTSSGVNPYLQTSDAASSRQLRNLRQEIDAAKVIYYPFRNASKVTLGKELNKVASVVFTTITDTSVVFQGTFQVNVSVPDIEETQTIDVTVPTITPTTEIVIDPTAGTKVQNYEIGEKILQFPIKCHKRDFANLYIHYSYDNVDQRIEYVGSLNNGGHVISLYYPVNKIDIDTTHTFEIWMSIENGDAVIESGGFIGAVSGQGLAATSQWNGMIEQMEFLDRMAITPVTVRPITEAKLTAITDTNNRANTFRDVLTRMPLRNIVRMRTLNDNMGDNCFDIIVRQQTVTFNIDNNKYIEVVEGNTQLRTTYVFGDKVIEIDTGNAVSADVRTDDLKTVESVVIT